MQEHLNEREERLRGVQDGFQRANDTTRCLQQELAETRKALRDEYRRHDQTVKIHERALATSTDKHTKTTTLLEVRTAELQAAETYLTKVDNVSDADLLSMVGELNSQIYQLAAQMSDKISFSSCPTNQLALPLELTQAVERSIGPAILHLLLIRGHSEDAICVQIALQACIVSFAHRIIETWDFETDAANDLLRRAYDSLKITENPAVSGRWRALTKATLRSLTQIDSFKSRLRGAMAEVIVDVVRVAGTSIALSSEELVQSITDNFREHLSAIIDMICSVHKVLGEDIVSSHIAPIFYPFGHVFDANCMEEAYPSGRHSDGQAYNAHPLSIFGTVEMGVQRIETNDFGVGHAGRLHYVTLLKPKVVVETLTNELQR
ncbi:hypothetical protein WOLCODRAFT_109039 [Wolfiporia cocos MD-104 SS10]|uniref:Uncharacterized protein n=1 Tax=Wolfiporia cocos (strain MD-104) TaxID=742152 RepID=A0A2H3JL03_WOLCO|nr:hypothetical protein WOLCODRAFT_109039 [Wolfiporia cocos MD-104 SS10]